MACPPKGINLVICLVMYLAATLLMDFLTAVRATTKPENSTPRLRSSFQ